MLFALKKVAAALLLPPASCLLLALAGWLLRRHGAPRAGAALLWLGMGSLLALSMPAVAALLTWLVYDGSRYEPGAARQAQAIVVLGGGLRVAPEYGGDTLARLSLERVRYGARIARDTGLPILVTGGRLFTRSAEGDAMRDALEREFGVAVRWVEPCAHNTHENARFSAVILQRAGVSRIVLVTHGVDARRARREFGAAGLRVIPAPTVIPRAGIDSALDLIPSAPALNESTLALYEMLANLALSLGMNASGKPAPPGCSDAAYASPTAERAQRSRMASSSSTRQAKRHMRIA
jgi:uncharacterized SAM-binding protein YcdF (DUF218 family)